MKVLFIWTNVDTRIESGLIHIGLAYLSASLKRAGHDTALIRLLNQIEKRELYRRVAEFNPDIIAFSVVTNQFDYNVHLADWIKEEFDVPVIFGGSHATLAPEETISKKSVDMLCRGEGGEAFVELAEKMVAGEDYSRVRNIWLRRDGEIIRNDVRPLIANLNEIPFMDLEIFDLNSMFKGGINLHFMAGRGCPYNCTYCCSPAFSRLYRGKGKIVRFRDVPVVIEEFKHHIRNYPQINYFTGQDETITLHKNWELEFCDLYKREINVPFSSMVRINHLDEEVLDALKDAGCDLIRVGLESGSEWLREHVLNRKMSDDKFIEIFDFADKIGIRTWAFIMFGLPHETPEMVEETIALTRRLNPNQVQLSIFYPYPGTELYEECRREGWLTDEKSFSYFEKSILNLPSISREQILNYYDSFNRELIEMAAKKERRGLYDFISHLDEAQIKTDDERFVRLTTFFEEYPNRFWIQAHPNSEISYNVELPPGSRLVFDIAMEPGTYARPGKGVRFEIEKDGKEMFSKYLDPKHRERDRGWFHFDLPLEGTGRSRLTLRTRPAPRSNNYYCNAGWGRPFITT